MSKLDELIAELCPQGVEYKKLGEIATISRGGNFQKKDYIEQGIPCIHYGQIYTYYGLFVNDVISYISEEVAQRQKMAVTNDVIMAVTSENIDDVCKCIAWLGENQVAVSGHTAIIHHNQNPKYMVYYLRSSMFYKQKVKLAHGTKVIEVTPDKLNNIIMPVPPLKVQDEIVRILDHFTELTLKIRSELTTELIARKKQYAYYAATLLSESQAKFPVTELGNIANFSYGYTDIAGDSGDARFIRITDIMDNGCLNRENKKYITLSEDSKKYLLKKGDIVMARTGATYGKTLYIPDETLAVYASFLIKITLDNTKMLNRFYWHYAQSSLYWSQANKLVSTGGQPQFNTAAISRVKVPVPSLDIQRRIVAVLDHFEAIYSNLNVKLTAEADVRQKQYEYYRDQLLMFNGGI